MARGSGGVARQLVMRSSLIVLLLPVSLAFGSELTVALSKPGILVLSPPEKGFFAKRLDFYGIPIKAPSVVVDDALYAAYGRLSMMLSNQPMVISNLVSAGAELHIIGRDQVTTD